MTDPDLPRTALTGTALTGTVVADAGDAEGGYCCARMRTSRRTVLRAAGLAALAGGGLAVVSACSGSSSGSAPRTPGQRVTVAASRVPEGGGIIINGYVVTQPAAGKYKAFVGICTHQGCPVGEIQNAQIICPCHGSHFSITDGAAVVGPATKPLPPANLKRQGNELVVSG